MVLLLSTNKYGRALVVTLFIEKYYISRSTATLFYFPILSSLFYSLFLSSQIRWIRISAMLFIYLYLLATTSKVLLILWNVKLTYNKQVEWLSNRKNVKLTYSLIRWSNAFQSLLFLVLSHSCFDNKYCQVLQCSIELWTDLIGKCIYTTIL